MFLNPTESLIIEGREGTDTIRVESLDAQFAAKLSIYGNRVETSGAPVVVDDPYVDTVTFTGSIDTGGGTLEVWADRVSVGEDVSISVGDGWITFRVRLYGIATLENLTPVAFVSNRQVSIEIGARAILEGTGIYLIAQAEDKSLADVLGAKQEWENFVIGPLAGLVEGLTALPVKVLVKSSTATITMGHRRAAAEQRHARPVRDRGRRRERSGVQNLFSIGYAQANARAVVEIETGAVLEAGAAAVVTAGATAIAKMSSSTARELASTPNPGAAQVALSLAVTNADAFAHVTVAQGARIEARKTANVVASGKVESEAGAESGIFADGAAGLAFGIEFSNADIHTTVDGTVIAHMDPGSVVKIEIDPLVTDEDDIGFVDYAGDMIHVGPHALVTEDIITYANRRGTSIGNLVSGRDYYVIQLSTTSRPLTATSRSGSSSPRRRSTRSAPASAPSSTPGT